MQNKTVLKLAPGFERQTCHPSTLSRTTAELLRPCLSRAQREYFLRCRANRIVAENPSVAVALPVKFARKLTRLTLAQLVSRQRQFARKASTAKHLLAKMSGFSSLRTHIAQSQDAALAAFGQVNAEIKARALACEGRLA